MANTGRGGLGGYTLHAAFDNVGGIASGADVRIAGLKVGSVTGLAIDPKTYQAVATFTVQTTSSCPPTAAPASPPAGCWAATSSRWPPAATSKMLADGGTITITQSAVNLEDLLGKFIFNVGNLADASQKQMDALKKSAAP